MFDGVHYVPILRSKKAEFDALRQLTDDDRRLTMPLIDILPSEVLSPRSSMPSDITPGLAKIAPKICATSRGYPSLIDLGRIAADGLSAGHEHPVLRLWGLVRRCEPLFTEFRPAIIPVVGLGRGLAYEAAVRMIVNRENLG